MGDMINLFIANILNILMEIRVDYRLFVGFFNVRILIRDIEIIERLVTKGIGSGKTNAVLVAASIKA
jgi:hypothetical protein